MASCTVALRADKVAEDAAEVLTLSLLEVTAPMPSVLVAVPLDPAGVMTSILTVQFVVAIVGADSPPPLRLIEPAPGVAVTTPPLQVVLALGVGATVTGKGVVGSVSVRVILVNADAPVARLMVIVKVETCVPAATIVGEKLLEAVIPCATLIVAVAAPVLLPCEVTNAPGAIVLVRVPVGALPAILTGTVMIQVPLAGMAPSFLLIMVPSGEMLTVPSQVVAGAGEAATVKASPGKAPIRVCRLSVKFVMLAAVVEEFTKVIVRVTTPVCTAVPLKAL